MVHLELCASLHFSGQSLPLGSLPILTFSCLRLDSGGDMLPLVRRNFRSKAKLTTRVLVVVVVSSNLSGCEWLVVREKVLLLPGKAIFRRKASRACATNPNLPPLPKNQRGPTQNNLATWSLRKEICKPEKTLHQNITRHFDDLLEGEH